MNKNWFYILWVVTLCAAVVALWQLYPAVQKLHKDRTHSMKTVQEATIITEPIQPIPLKVYLDKRNVVLGKRLFHDTRLSGDNTVACASCHDLKKGGVDGLIRSIGINGTIGDMNTPTVFNSGFNFKQFWNGRAETLEDQVAGPTHNPKEMGSNWKEITEKLKKDPEYVQAFDELYSDGITGSNIQKAIATFERSLYTPNARFDKFLRGDQSAITSDEKKGYRLFKDVGCIVCHQGVNIGGNMFQNFGKFGNYFVDRGDVTVADYGRFNVTGEERDRYKFKVPSLRNVAKTAPYFHDGSTETLDEAVRTMAKYQLGMELPDEDIDFLLKFLKTLTGEYEGEPV